MPADRLRLRPLTEADLPRWRQWIELPEVAKYLVRPQTLSTDHLRAYDPARHRVLAIETATKLHIGICGLHNIFWQHRRAELGIYIGVAGYRGQGYGTEALHLLVRHAFDDLGLQRLSLRVLADNTRAVCCYEKVGFVVEGRLERCYLRSGRYHDELLMRLLAREYRPPATKVAAAVGGRETESDS